MEGGEKFIRQKSEDIFLKKFRNKKIIIGLEDTL